MSQPSAHHERYPGMDRFYAWDGDTLVLNVLGRPRARRDAIGRVLGLQLEVFVTAIPRAGEATAYMLRFLSDVFDVRDTDIEVVFGLRNVNKQLRIRSPGRLPEVIKRPAQELVEP